MKNNFNFPVSVIIITFRRQSALNACLSSLWAAAARARPLEIITAVNGRDDETAVFLRGIEKKYTLLKVLELPRMCRGEARNAALKASSGGWICFLDDDTEVPPDYFSNLASEIRKGGADVLGGGQAIDPVKASVFERAACFALSSFWGAGPFRVRFRSFYGRRPAGPNEFILCNLAFRREVLGKELSPFKGHLTSAEENLLLNELAAAGIPMRLTGGLNLIHRRRWDLASFSGQIFRSGMGRAQITFLYPDGFTFFTILPALGAFLSICALLFSPGFFKAGIFLYFAGSALSAIPALRDGGAKTASICFTLFFATHFSYAAGWCWGILGLLKDLLRRGEHLSRCVCEIHPKEIS
ncbi:MAG: hypothetical protein A2270_07620 [Elusimicrobia bacterium RIFOXYA12_FULL_51_18]|nr:MAG: hypothetical protein A2270_07620 [Elusimicrobia bacterium RIFOXYA12_FULL_51_18]OGS29934.1 MAG: hypothetical protein A2218_12290 [Elusimicrobia bacterium RIFOXYA2_FULL_53_38]